VQIDFGNRARMTSTHSAPLRVAIIGGGWAGMAAAVELAASGVPVTVYEASRQPGGRARGFTRNGLQLDNGQHILLGAYRETLRLMQRVGVDFEKSLLRLPLRLDTPGHLTLATPALPAPLHLLVGLLHAQGLEGRERLAALRFVVRLRLQDFQAPPAQTVTQLLAGQPEKLVRLLWEPLCLAALNTPIRQASAQVFLNVLRDSFSRARSDSDLLLPRADLSTLFPQMATRFVERHGGRVLLGKPVASLQPTEDAIVIEDQTYSHAVCAVAPFALSRLLDRVPHMDETIAGVNALAYQPIATVYLQYAPSVALPFPMLGLVGGYGQWMLDRGALCGQHGLLAVVISAEGPHLQLDHAALAAAVHEELKLLLGDLPPPLWHQVVVEKRATFACTAGLQRPSCATPHPRIFLAGDYVASDYPATLEGAVRSGVQCAHLLLDSAGRTASTQ
jgi:squalene-associated FAD-dependent desaturase